MAGPLVGTAHHFRPDVRDVPISVDGHGGDASVGGTLGTQLKRAVGWYCGHGPDESACGIE